MPVELHHLKAQSIAKLGEVKILNYFSLLFTKQFLVREHENVLPLLFERCKTDEEIGTALYYIFDKFEQRNLLINDALKEIKKIPRTERTKMI